MPNRPTRIIVRCEDVQQRVFIYRCLCKNGIHQRAIQIRNSPGGDAKQFVLDQYPTEVKALRRTPHVSQAVISMIDADDRTTEDRKREHDSALKKSGQEHRNNREKIAILVPRRNIETWIHHLLGEAVDEHGKYPRFRGKESKCAPAAEEFARRCPNDMRDTDLPSLHDGCAELQRILA